MHYLIDLSIGLSISSSGAITSFCTQALGLFIEDLICNTCIFVRRISQDKPTRSQEVLGYIWVGVFLAWPLPAYVYPMLYRGNSDLKWPRYSSQYHQNVEGLDCEIPLRLQGWGDIHSEGPIKRIIVTNRRCFSILSWAKPHAFSTDAAGAIDRAWVGIVRRA